MTNLFDETRCYLPTDPEILCLLGSRAKQAQMRYHHRSPVFFRLGRKIVYHGADLNAWANASRIDPKSGACKND